MRMNMQLLVIVTFAVIAIGCGGDSATRGAATEALPIARWQTGTGTIGGAIAEPGAPIYAGVEVVATDGSGPALAP